jgi:hypothetical protein
MRYIDTRCRLALTNQTAKVEQDPRVLRRTWKPSTNLEYRFRVSCAVPINQLIAHNQCCGFDQISFNSIRQSRRLWISTSLVVAIDGPCRNNGLTDPAPKAAYGVWFGANSTHNSSGILPSDFRHTINTAELYAARVAIDTLDDMFLYQELEGIEHVIIQTESELLALSMSKYIWEWIAAGGTNSRNSTVYSWKALEGLHREICRFEQRGINIRFWRERGLLNTYPKRLANKALDAAEEEAALENQSTSYRPPHWVLYCM